MLRPHHSNIVNGLQSQRGRKFQTVLPVMSVRISTCEDLDDEIDSAGGVDRFEFIGFLTRGSKTCCALFKY